MKSHRAVFFIARCKFIISCILNAHIQTLSDHQHQLDYKEKAHWS